MIVPSVRRPFAAWGFVVDLVRAVTQPRADVAQCDARVEAIAADSAIVGGLSGLVNLFRRAADDSAAVAAARRVIELMMSEPLADRVRAVGVMAGIAAMTTLALRGAATEREPLTYVIPAAVAILAAICVVASRAIARAIAGYHS
jgi:hypothetical protein